VGLASSYYEHVTQNFQRLTDSDWEDLLGTNPPADVPWLQDLVVH